MKDDVTRVGREPLRKLSASDRLINPTLTAQKAGVETPNLLLGIGAALHYNNAEDAQSVQMQQLIAERGLRAALAEIASLAEDAPLLDAAVEAYAAVEQKLK